VLERLVVPAGVERFLTSGILVTGLRPLALSRVRGVAAKGSRDGVRHGSTARKALCLLSQPFVKDQGLTVQELLKALIAKTGENVVIRRFVKFGVGESA